MEVTAFIAASKKMWIMPSCIECAAFSLRDGAAYKSGFVVVRISVAPSPLQSQILRWNQ